MGNVNVSFSGVSLSGPCEGEHLWLPVTTFFLNKIKILFLFLAALCLRCWAPALSSCGARASHCGGFSCCGARALGAWASVVVARGL